MKKTMFITSIVMVVVLAVALTTSSLAWFAAGGNTSVTVSQFQIQAKNNAAAAGLQISNLSNGPWQTQSINLLTAAESAWVDDNDHSKGIVGVSRSAFDPLVPIGSIAQSNNLYSSNDLYKLLRGEMYTAKIVTRATNDVLVDYFQTAPVQGAALQRDFYIRNTGESAATISIQLSATIDDSQSARSYNATLYVALFDETGATYVAKVPAANENPETPASLTGNVSLISFASSKTGATTFVQPSTAWAADDAVAGVNAQTLTIDNLDIATLTLEATSFDTDGHLVYTPHHLRLIAWFDGEELQNANSDTKVNIEISFSVS